jgi:hypothetical protein
MFLLQHTRQVTAKRITTFMKDEQKPKSSKKVTYQAPAVVRVSLRPEEAVLGHCKTATSGGPVSAGSCRSTFCRTFGS